MLTQPQGTSVKIKAVNDSGTTTEIDMISTVAALSPILTSPSILDVIRNTTAVLSKDQNGSTIYKLSVKPDSDLYITYDEGQKKSVMKLDPRTAAFEEIEEYALRINPQLRGKKYRSLAWDGDMATIGQLLSTYVASFMEVRRVQKELTAFTMLDDAAKAISITGDPTTFKTGSHIETITTQPTADDLYKAFADARTLALSLGLDKAPGDENKNYKHAIGTSVLDWVCIMSPEASSILKTKNGIFNSAPGFEAFSSLGIQAVLGVNVLISNLLPDGVNFMFITTGRQGTIGYQLVGKMIGGTIIPDPDAYGLAYRLNLWDQYSLGVVIPFQILIHKTNITP